MFKILQFLAILILFCLPAWADRICMKVIDGEKVYTNLCDSKDKKVLSKNFLNKTKNLTRYSTFQKSRKELEEIVEEKSRVYGVDAKLIKEMIREESNWNVNAVSPKGAMGIMQLMPSTAIILGVKNPFDPFENIDAGVRYMKYLLEKFNGNITLALAAYNAGAHLVESIGRVPNINETQNYVRRISLRYLGNIQENVSFRKAHPIKAIILSDGTVLYTNQEDMYIWSTK